MSMQRHLLVTSASVRTEGTYNAPSVAVAMQGSFAEAPRARVAEAWSSSRSSTSGARAPRTERRLGARCSSRCGETAAAGIPCARAGRIALPPPVRARIPRDARRVPVLRERGRRKRKAPAGRRVRRCVRGSREGAVRAPGGGSEGAGRDRVNGDYERDREMRRWNTRKYREKRKKRKRKWKKNKRKEMEKKKREKDNTMYATK